MTDPPPQLYAKYLLPFGNGYPLWTPEPSHELLVRRRDGLRIGDVGVIDLENGSFDVFFNTCLPRDHPLHQVTGVPDNFVPIELNEWDIASFPHAEYPGRVISTSSVTAKTIEPSADTTSRPFTYEFSLSSSEGALLVLPNGAESYKLRKRQIFKDVATRNAADWYKFAEQNLGRILTRDSLYLITGLHKTSSWSVAAFHKAIGTAESPAQFKASQVGGSNDMAYTWETTRALDWRVGPQIDVGIPNQSVFISGFKIAIREGILGKRWVEVKVDAPLALAKRSVKFADGGNGPSASRAGNLLGRFVSRSSSGGRKSAGQTLPAARPTKEPTVPLTSAPQSEDAGATGSVAINHVPQPLQSLHPSDVINRYLLSKEPSASVAITHDTQWCILFEKGLLKPEDLGHDDQLERIVTENYRLVSQEGVVCLQNICDSSIRLTGIDDAAREAWGEDKLHDAEEILSRQIISRTGSDHTAFANRALIRARLHHWDAALRDAETSIDIQPSVVAHVAKGFTLFGQEKYRFAVEAFNVALRQCDVNDRDIVLLIKSIVLFEVGYHAESMAGIADLIGRCPAKVKPACSSVQAEMHVRLARLVVKKKDYDRALQLLTRAQSLGPIHAVPDLKIVSLVCGWEFDNLEFSIQQQKCEVLDVAGRTNEAVESLQTMTHALGEDIRTRRDNAEWITKFTQRCLRSLENLGDNAMTSQNYTEAITRYSMALSMGPVTREGILIKRSKAYAAACTWDDALKDADEVINLNPFSPSGYERKYESLQGMGRYDEAIRAFDDMHSILEPSVDPQALQSLRAIQTLNPRTLTHHNHPPRHSPNHNPAAEPIITPSQPPSRQPRVDMTQLEREEVILDQDLTARLLKQQRSVQLGELLAQITALREQLGSDATTSERDRALCNQLTEVSNTILRSPDEQGMARSQEDDLSQATRSMPVPLDGGEQVPNEIVEEIQESISRQEPGALTTPSGHVPVICVERSPQVPYLVRPPAAWRISPELEQHDPPNLERGWRQFPRAHRRYRRRSDDYYSPERGRRRRHSNDHADHSDDTPRYERRQHRERSRDSASGDESAGARISYRRPSDISGYSVSEAGNVNMQYHHAPHTNRNIVPPPTPPGQILPQPQIPLHDALLEMLREQRIAHRASIRQQQEMTNQMWGFSEWLMKEMQDRLTDLRGVSTRTSPYPPRQRDGHFHWNTQPHYGFGSAGPVGVTPPAPPPYMMYSSPTPYGWVNTPWGGTHFAPPVSSWAQQPPYIHPGPTIVHESRAPGDPQRPTRRAEGNGEHAPLRGSTYPHGTLPRAPPEVVTSPAAPESVSREPTSSGVQAASKGPERDSTTSMVTLVQSPTIATGVPEHDSPKKSTSGVGDKGGGKMSKSAEDRRPGTVTSGKVTYI